MGIAVRQPDVLTDADGLLIRHLPGTSPTLVVAFTGVKHAMGGIPDMEFVGSAAQGATNHVAFVSDMQRTWYSATGLQDRVVATLGRLTDRLGVQRVICLGNSMGGHGALLFARRLQAAIAIAFVPQYSLHPSVIAEARWKEFRAGVRLEGLGDLSTEIDGNRRYHAIFGTGETRDLPHAGLLQRDGHVAPMLLEGAGHNVCAMLKARGLLSPAIAAMMADDVPTLTRLMDPHLAAPSLTIQNEGARHDHV